MLRAFRLLVLVTSFLLMAAATWAEIELINNQFLQAWLSERGLWWLEYAPLLVAIVGLTTYAQALLRWPRIIEAVPLRSRDPNAPVPPAQRLTDRGQVFEAHEDYPPDLDRSRSPIMLPTNSQGPSINELPGPGASAAASNVPTAASKGGPAVALPTAGKPESEIVIPDESPLVQYALGVDRRYRLVQPEPGTPTLQRVRGVLVRGKNTDDRRTVDSDSKVS